jgi:hypothetical protein
MMLADLKLSVRARYSNCPGMYVEDVAARLQARLFLPGLLTREMDAMVESVIRHQLTDYDRLRTTHELTREEARLSVADEVADWLARWRGTD